ncbi:MAG: ABC transporter permease subunit [Roseiflexaceae bacterium]|nr:ABC transporter permease subunit [Roseiflexaceae bacterium]
MQKTLLIFQKEWLELRQQRGLLLSALFLPALLTLLPVVMITGARFLPQQQQDLDELGGLIAANTTLQGMSLPELGQAVAGLIGSSIFTLTPLLLPSILAAYSIVGEKANRTLEPILASPIKTWELLLGKSLASIAPSVVITWGCAVFFAIAVRTVALSPRVAQAIISPGWVALIVLCTPLMALITTAGMIIISSRVNDPRTAQQYSAVGVLPLMLLVFGQLGGLLVLNVGVALLAALALALLAALVTWLAVQLFQREVILTRWR